MKIKLPYITICLIAFASCKESSNEELAVKVDSSIESIFGQTDFPKLGNKEPIFRMAYEVETLSKRNYLNEDIPDSSPLVSNLEPNVFREKHYYEVYEDFSMAHAIEKMEPKMDNISSRRSSTSELETVFIKDVDGLLTSYNSKGEIITSSASTLTYFDGADQFKSPEELGNYLYKKAINPKLVKEKTMAIYKASSESLTNNGNTINVRMYDENAAARTAGNGLADYYEVVLNEEYGVPVYEIGYASDGSPLDKNSFFYEFDSDSSLLLVAEQYQVLRYSEAMDAEYISVTNSFYENYYAESF